MVSDFNNFLYVPEAWERTYSKLRSYNEALENVASVIYALLSAGTLFLFIWAYSKGYIRWKFSLCLAFIAALFSLLDTLNEWPSLIHDYDTTVSPTVFFTNTLVGAGTGALFTGFY